MIRKCNLEDINEIYDYIGNDYQNCLYTYIDLVKYGLNNENFNVWIQLKNGQICCVISEYYGGFQIYSKEYDLISDELIDFLKEKECQGVSGCKESMDQIKHAFPTYQETIGIIGKLEKLSYEPNPAAYSAPLNEMEEIAKIISKDKNLSKHHSYESLCKQLCERKKDNFGRNFILRDEKSNDIICHAATFA